MTTREPETCTCEDHKECIECVHYEDCAPHGGAAAFGIIAIMVVMCLIILIMIA